MGGSPPCAIWTDCTVEPNGAATATASGNALLATAEKSVGNRIERIMIQKIVTRYARLRRAARQRRAYLFHSNSHAMKRSPNEEDRDQKEDRRQNQR